jgi:hypothetical protein
MVRMIIGKSALMAVLAVSSSTWTVQSFILNHKIATTVSFSTTSDNATCRRREKRFYTRIPNSRRLLKLFSTFDDNEEDDDDEYIEIDSLGDWRNFRRSLTLGAEDEEDSIDDSSTRVSLKDSNDGSVGKTSSQSKTRKKATIKSVSEDNEEVLRSQNEELAKEYMTGVWAHETSTVSITNR